MSMINQTKIILIIDDAIYNHESNLKFHLDFINELFFNVNINNQLLKVNINHKTTYFYNNILFEKEPAEALITIGNVKVDKVIIRKINWHYKLSSGSYFLAEKIFLIYDSEKLSDGSYIS